MVLFDDIFAWQGWGGAFNLAAGRCRMRIFDLSGRGGEKLSMLKPFVVVVSDLAHDGPSLKRVTVKSCASHIATSVVAKFKLEPHRTLFVEYYPRSTYGAENEHVIEEKFEQVDFVWHNQKALHPTWKPLGPPLMDTIKQLLICLPERK